MKYFILVLFISQSLSFPILAQQNEQKDIKTLMKLIKIEPTMKGIVENGIELIKKQKPNVPREVWNNIKSSIDYNSYSNRVEKIFYTNYTSEEIKNLIKEAKANPNELPFFKQIVQQQLYDAGKQFGKNYANSILQILSDKGY